MTEREDSHMDSDPRNRGNHTGGYECIHRDLMAKLESVDLEQAAENLLLQVRGGDRLVVPLLGRTYLVGRAGVAAEDGAAVRLAVGSVLAGYVLTMGRGGPSGQFVPLASLTGMVSSQPRRLGGGLGRRLARVIEKDPRRFGQTLSAFGGQPVEVAGDGSHRWTLELLPRIPVQIIFYPADEEFPCDARLLVDSHATRYLEFEFLAVLVSVFVDEVIDSVGRKR